MISSYGCDHMTADAEFLLSKAKYKASTGREQRRDADVLCYQIRQSFKPGEITPEEANRIGYETAMHWTKGKYFNNFTVFFYGGRYRTRTNVFTFTNSFARAAPRSALLICWTACAAFFSAMLPPSYLK